MKYLLTSGGIKNKSIHNELLRLLNKPIEECAALCITTASYARSNGAKMAYEYINGLSPTPMCELGWKSIGNLELSALSQCEPEVLIEQASKADVFLVNGGDPLFLYYWMKESGFDQLIPKLDAVYVGLSAGSMVITPRIGSDFVNWNKHHMSDETCNLVPFSIFPHLNHIQLPDNNLENAQKWAAEIGSECYAICDETALSIVDSQVRIISEGTWKKFPNES